MHELTLRYCLNEHPHKLPLAAMREVGPACQTLGGLLRVTRKQTFMAVEGIARESRLPVPTVRKHLATLIDAEWVNKLGRSRRRTPTLELTEKTLDSMSAKKHPQTMLYGIRPIWAPAMPWSSTAVFSIVMARLHQLKSLSEKYAASVKCEWNDVMENIYGDERYAFSLSDLEGLTGLQRASIWIAKRRLASIGIVRWERNNDDNGLTSKDRVIPNLDFVVCTTPSG